MINQRDLLLVPFPFSDQSGRKVRPVAVISNQTYNDFSEDIIVVGVTSNTSKDKYSTGLTIENLDEGTLIVPCSIKAENVLRLAKELVIKKIGRVSIKKHDEVIRILQSILAS